MQLFVKLALLVCFVGSLEARHISFTNKCGQPIWISPLTNGNGPPLAEGIMRLDNGQGGVYNIPDSGWGGRFWPKTGCDGSGHNCETGQSMPPCLANGCDPPAETKVEFFFDPVGGGATWYDISLVDGYSLAAEIIPSVQQGTCITTKCAMSLDSCPTNEAHVGDLRAIKNGRTAFCLAPCKKWNFPAPYGLGQPETIDPGLHLCCPTPPIYPEECRTNIVVDTQYVNLIHRDCPTAYSYSYDDEAGLHDCPNTTTFDVIFCP